MPGFTSCPGLSGDRGDPGHRWWLVRPNRGDHRPVQRSRFPGQTGRQPRSGSISRSESGTASGRRPGGRENRCPHRIRSRLRHQVGRTPVGDFGLGGGRPNGPAPRPVRFRRRGRESHAGNMGGGSRRFSLDRAKWPGRHGLSGGLHPGGAGSGRRISVLPERGGRGCRPV
jgi:hypothetical protein